MTNDIKVLIECIQRGDLQAIRAAALQVLRSDRTQKDANYCKYMIGALERKKKCFELPANLADVLIVEDTNETFIPERYHLTDANKAILDDIVAVNSVAARLSQKRIRYANSTLLYGESGTGKTTFGRCVANQLGLPFLYISFSSLISSLLGETGKRLKKVFDFVCEQRCVFMIDELDAIGTTRGSSQDVTEISRVAIALMQALDTIGNNVILIGATNRIKDIDPAILRRFTRKYEVKKFTAPESCAFVKKYLEDCGFSVTGEMLAAATKSNTPSELERNINELIVNLEIQKGECSI